MQDPLHLVVHWKQGPCGIQTLVLEGVHLSSATQGQSASQPLTTNTPSSPSLNLTFHLGTNSLFLLFDFSYLESLGAILGSNFLYMFINGFTLCSLGGWHCSGFSFDFGIRCGWGRGNSLVTRLMGRRWGWYGEHMIFILILENVRWSPGDLGWIVIKLSESLSFVKMGSL